ncbi:PBSX family phage terminase large subunit [Peptoniphilus sp. HMSC075B08]|uniref:PBSX family phage terminase large subunit n=1 Tax=Peptoniphilus sp. HMSC075B08 TaxID=1739525 RepID=UPI0009F4F79B|nr:PBSX family phage terminase large subunit [Peptoniphilus sp. HMSC075B08]
MNLKTNEVYLPEVIGKGYGTYWNYKGRYRVVKGSRASKKSTTTALNMIYRIMTYPDSNGLVIRKVFRTVKDSCFSQLKWAIHRLKVDKYWKATNSPLELTYLPTGQKILFRGLDDPLKVTSVAVDKGSLCFLWIEEAYEIMSEDDFNMLDESIRGQVPDGLFKQITLTLNPWNDRHWIKRRFFDREDKDILAITTNYKCNEWLDQADLKVFDEMKIHNPKRYRVAGLGEWGVVDGLVYENIEEKRFDISSLVGQEGIESVFGLDFGYTNDPTALFCGLIDLKNKVIYVFDELYKKGLSNKRIYEEVEAMGPRKESIIADSAEPKSIDELRSLGLTRVRAAKKGKDSILNGIQFIQDFKLVIHPRCVNFLTEVTNYQWAKDKFDNSINKPIDDFNHLMDAMRYAIEPYIIKHKNSVQTFRHSL